MNRDYEIIQKKAAYDGYFRITELTLRHALFAGGQTPTIVRECFERGHAVGVLPYDPWEDQVVLVEQFRVGAMQAGFSPWVLETVAGMIEPGESPQAVAHREAQEEADCDSASWCQSVIIWSALAVRQRPCIFTVLRSIAVTCAWMAMGLPMMPRIFGCMYSPRTRRSR